MWRPPSLFLQKPREKSSFFIISPIKSILFLNFSGIHLRSTLGISWVKYHLRSILGSFAVSGSLRYCTFHHRSSRSQVASIHANDALWLVGSHGLPTSCRTSFVLLATNQKKDLIPLFQSTCWRCPADQKARRLWVRDWPTLGRMWIWRGWRPEGAINCENVIRPGSIVTTKRRSQAIRSHLYSASASDWRSVVSGNVSAYGTDNTCWKTSVLTLHNFAL